ncbi:MAG: ABC transporter permease [Phototrophicaceae bacterium]
MTAKVKNTESAGFNPMQTVRRILTIPAVGPLLALIVAGAYFYSQNPRFLTAFNISLILQQTSWIAALAIGQTLIILTAGIDLSNGSVMALGTVVMTTLAVQSGLDPALALLLCFVVTIGFGVLNGVLVTQLNIPPFIVTLGTLNIAFALTRIVATTTITNLPDLHVIFGQRYAVDDFLPQFAESSNAWLTTSFTTGAMAVIVLYFIVWWLLRETDFGRHVYAVGDDPEAARLMGIPVNRVLITVYALAGLFYGIAGWILVGRIGSGDPNAGQTANLDSITAVVIGGTSLFGGRGNVLGSLIGALIVGVFINGLQITGVDPLYQRLITGVLVIGAVALDQFSQRIR